MTGSRTLKHRALLRSFSAPFGVFPVPTVGWSNRRFLLPCNRRLSQLSGMTSGEPCWTRAIKARNTFTLGLGRDPAGTVCCCDGAVAVGAMPQVTGCVGHRLYGAQSRELWK
ncbi:polysaccharide deacetylase [Aspergillus luchuensis]|uniref:Polysaccharide deacetylase n=1 Tax=Aspergillus kawachii TaxID=1069201 RepID=A0A146EY95_ASPKA|nr:polysaccharide deacetylase [Aspergillus luchuensis]